MDKAKMNFKLTKTVLSLLLIFLLALTLRIIAAYNLDPGTDEIIYSVMGLDFISSGQLSTIGQIPLYFYTLDIIYKVFGLEVWAMRLLNIALGSLAVLLLFLIGKELFNKKTGLLSAFLFAVSSFAIINNVESDMASIFFVLLSFLFFVKGFKEQKYFYLSITFLGIAYLFKEIALLLLPAYMIYFGIEYFSQQKEHRSRFKLINLAVISMLILFTLLLPVLTHNYLAYQQKGVVDVRVSKYLRLDLDIYKTLGARTTAEGFDFGRSMALSKGIFNNLLKEDPVIIILSLLGIILLWKKEQRKAIFLLLLCISVPWLFYTQGDGGHDLIFVPFFTLLSANFLIFVKEKYFKNTNVKKGAAIVALALIMVITLVALKEKLSKDTTTLKLIDYAETVPPESIILLDPRVYNAPVVLAFMDKHYLEEPNIARFFQVIGEAPERIPVPLYYIECAWEKPCGWKQKDHDAVASQGEELSKVITEKMILDHEVSLNNEVMLRIYKGGINVPLGIYPAIDETHFLFYYPVGWKNKDKIYDAYTPETIPDKILYALSRTVLHLAFLIALLGIVMVFYFWIKSPEETTSV